jgi:hypothetical protein
MHKKRRLNRLQYVMVHQADGFLSFGVDAEKRTMLHFRTQRYHDFKKAFG